MSVAWSWAFDTPFKWTKQVASHFGGTRQGMAISWPGHIKDVGGIRTQFHHMIDIVPTILEATGIKAPEDRQRHSAKAHRRREHGLHVRLGECARRRRSASTQYFEMFCNRGIYHDGWYACTTPPDAAVAAGHKPRCRRSTTTSGNSTTLRRTSRRTTTSPPANPDKLKEMQALFLTEAAKYQVLPLDNSILPRLVTPRPSAVAGRNGPHLHG